MDLALVPSWTPYQSRTPTLTWPGLILANSPRLPKRGPVTSSTATWNMSVSCQRLELSFLLIKPRPFQLLVNALTSVIIVKLSILVRNYQSNIFPQLKHHPKESKCIFLLWLALVCLQFLKIISYPLTVVFKKR